MMTTNLYSAYMIRGNVNSSDIIEEIKNNYVFSFQYPAHQHKKQNRWYKWEIVMEIKGIRYMISYFSCDKIMKLTSIVL